MSLHTIPASDGTKSYTVTDVTKIPTDYGDANQIRDRGAVTFTVKPDEGQYLTELTINNVDCLTGSGSGDVTVKNNRDGSYTITVKNVKDNITLTAASMQFQTVQETLTAVPKELGGIFQTVDALQNELRTKVQKANGDVPNDQTALLDIKLQYTEDSGKTWQDATAEHFPKGGIQVTIPYNALGNTDSSYTFAVIHMFTTTMNGHTVGATETITPTTDARGLHFTVTSLSPFAVGWTKTTTPKPVDPNPGGGSGGGGGEGGTVSTYPVTVEKPQHGTVTADTDEAAGGNTVTLTVTPDSGYALDTLTATDSKGGEVKLAAQSGGKYTFTMPNRAVTVKATFSPLSGDAAKPCDGGASCPSRGFTDVGGVGTWYHEAVDYVLRNNLMGGYGNGRFGPNNNLTRAQLAQILYNREGKPAVTGSSPFTDVADGAWYSDAVTWAAAKGIVSGYGNGKFGPNDSITREQLAAILWRCSKSPAAANQELHFNDADEISGYALEAMRWAVENGILNGYGNGRLAPKGLAARAQVAQVLKNFMENQEDDT